MESAGYRKLYKKQRLYYPGLGGGERSAGHLFKEVMTFEHFDAPTLLDSLNLPSFYFTMEAMRAGGDGKKILIKRVAAYLLKASESRLLQERDKKRDKKILEAIEKIDRESFMPAELKKYAYIDGAFSIGEGQTISQPSTVARMLQVLELENGSSVLEIGTGSGWNAALIGRITGKTGRVVTTEIILKLAGSARKNLKKAGAKNIKVVLGDFRKIKEKFDRIIFTAGMSDEQLRIIEKTAERNLNKEGILVCPFRRGPLLIIKKDKKGVLERDYTVEEYVFVPLVVK